MSELLLLLLDFFFFSAVVSPLLLLLLPLPFFPLPPFDFLASAPTSPSPRVANSASPAAPSEPRT
jgi:hypothetical protein